MTSGFLIAAAGLILLLSGWGILRHALARLVWLVVPPFRVGDTVSIGAYSGKVEGMGWQTVQLRSSSGDLISVPNAEIANQPVVQSVAESGSQGVEITFPVPSTVDPGTALRAAEEAVSVSPYLAIDRPIAAALERGEDGGVSVRMQAGVFDSSLRNRFESSVIEVFEAYLQKSESA